MRALLICGATGLLTAAVPAFAQDLKCEWLQKEQCQPGQRCGPAALGMWATIDLTSQRYQRCDQKGCDAYKAVVSRSGAFTIVELPGRATFLKIGPEGRSTEVTSIMNTVLVSQGICR